MYTRTLRFHPCPRVVMRMGVVCRPSRRRSPPNKRPRRQRYVTECVDYNNIIIIIIITIFKIITIIIIIIVMIIIIIIMMIL